MVSVVTKLLECLVLGSPFSWFKKPETAMQILGSNDSFRWRLHHQLSQRRSVEKFNQTFELVELDGLNKRGHRHFSLVTR